MKTIRLAANDMVCVVNQAAYLLKRQLESQGQTFVERGGSDLRPARLKGEHDEQGAIPPTRAEGPCRRANLGPTGPA